MKLEEEAETGEYQGTRCTVLGLYRLEKQTFILFHKHWLIKQGSFIDFCHLTPHDQCTSALIRGTWQGAITHKQCMQQAAQLAFISASALALLHWQRRKKWIRLRVREKAGVSDKKTLKTEGSFHWDMDIQYKVLRGFFISNHLNQAASRVMWVLVIDISICCFILALLNVSNGAIDPWPKSWVYAMPTKRKQPLFTREQLTAVFWQVWALFLHCWRTCSHCSHILVPVAWVKHFQIDLINAQSKVPMKKFLSNELFK